MTTEPINSECPICLQKFIPGVPPEIICSNRHALCKQCLNVTLTSPIATHGCPQCRQPILVRAQRLSFAVRSRIDNGVNATELYIHHPVQHPPPQPNIPVNFQSLFPGLVATLLVWWSTGINCYYFIFEVEGKAYALATLFIFMSVLYQSIIMRDKSLMTAQCRDRTASIIAHLCLFPLARQPMSSSIEKVFIFSKEIVLVVVMVCGVTVGDNSKGMMFYATLCTNCMSIVYYYALSMKVRQQTLVTWSFFLQRTPGLHMALFVLLILVGNGFFYLSLMLLFQYNSGITLAIAVIMSTECLVYILYLKRAQKTYFRVVYSIPFLMSIRSCLYKCSSNQFVNRLGQIYFNVLRLCIFVMLISACQDSEELFGTWCIVKVGCFICSMFSLVEYPIASTLAGIP